MKKVLVKPSKGRMSQYAVNAYASETNNSCTVNGQGCTNNLVSGCACSKITV